jgi:hypothetical protein
MPRTPASLVDLTLISQAAPALDVVPHLKSLPFRLPSFRSALSLIVILNSTTVCLADLHANRPILAVQGEVL